MSLDMQRAAAELQSLDQLCELKTNTYKVIEAHYYIVPMRSRGIRATPT